MSLAGPTGWDSSGNGEEWVSLRCIFEGKTELYNKSGMEIEGKGRIEDDSWDFGSHIWVEYRSAYWRKKRD